WLLEPKQLDETGRLWRPGIKYGVKAGSFFQTTECFGPVLGLVRAKSLKHAIEIQNSSAYGLTAGIHSLNTTEIKTWCESVDAGNLYVNRGITGAIVQRQPFGGFKRSSVGFGLKAGGPNYILQFGTFKENQMKFAGINQFQISGVKKNIAKHVQSVELLMESNREHLLLEMAAASDEYWTNELFKSPPTAGELTYEGNYHRYLINPCTVRVSADATKAKLARVVQALLLANHSEHSISISPEFLERTSLTKEQLIVLTGGLKYVVEENLETVPSRLILVGSKEESVLELESNPDLFVYDLEHSKSARVLSLVFYREQSISITQHRFGALQSELQ
ncbi:MAG: aldehyde dehydrogenase family protein, partial [Microbacteriaceae bacterium]|nr:aldehyde dehydrogenase family protein [Microbacteriaceae bacterium]